MAVAFLSPLSRIPPLKPTPLKPAAPSTAPSTVRPFVPPPKSPLQSLRHLILGPAALSHEANLLRYHSPSTIAIARLIVIHADYLSDLAVVDLVKDLLYTPSLTAFLSALLGFLLSLPVADVLCTLSYWLRRNVVPKDLLRFVSTVKEEPRDLFLTLVNSCALVTPLLVVLVCWAEWGENVAGESFGISVLSLLAVEPLLRKGGYECRVVKQLRLWGVLTEREGGIWGLWEKVGMQKVWGETGKVEVGIESEVEEKEVVESGKR